MIQDPVRFFILDQTLMNFHGHHFEYDISIAESAHAAGLAPTIISNYQFTHTGGDRVTILPWFRTSWYESQRQGQFAQTFWNDTLRFFVTHKVNSADIVLIHTVSFPEFEAILDYYSSIASGEVARLPTLFLIMRRDPAECSLDLLRRYREKLAYAFSAPNVENRLVLATDTEELSAAWSSILNNRFLTFPIPFRHALLDSRIGQKKKRQPLQIVYLGDARPEKGYQFFPQMVDVLWEEHVRPRHVEITLQSNYNLPGGEPGIAQARLLLQRYPYGVYLLTDILEPETYYDILAKADIVVLPYDTKAYAARSSGVLNESLVAGKVTVVPDKSWLSAQVAPDRAVIYDHPTGLFAAVIKAINSFESLSLGATKYKAVYRQRQSPDNFIKVLLENVKPVPERPGGSVLYLMDGDSVVDRTGAGSVARQQLQALIELGYRVHAVFQRIHVDGSDTVDSIRQWMTRIFEETRSLNLASVWGVGHAPFYRLLDMTKEQYILSTRTIILESDARYRAALSIPGALIQQIRDDFPEFVLVNYAQSIPLAQTLVGTKPPILCETLDVQAFQFAIRDPKGFSKETLDFEMGLLKRATHTLAISQLEADFLSTHLGKDRVTFIPQPVNARPVTFAMLAGAADLGDIVDACGPSKRDMGKSFRHLRSIDLLYVSSAHGPNIEGFRNFCHHVFYSRLSSLGYTLIVAGSICDAIKDLEGPSLMLAGRVATLDPLYAAAKVVVLPVLSGAGSAIKTIEALAYAKPIVATSMAMRGINRSQATFPTFNDWPGFGNRIIELLTSADMRRIEGRKSDQLSVQNGNDGHYTKRLAKAIAATTQATSPQGAPGQKVTEYGSNPASAREPSHLVEWAEWIGSVNSTISTYVKTGYVGAQALDNWNRASIDDNVIEELFDGYRSEYSRQFGVKSKEFAALDEAIRRIKELTKLPEGKSNKPAVASPLNVAVAPGGLAQLLTRADGGTIQEIRQPSSKNNAYYLASLEKIELMEIPKEPHMALRNTFDLRNAPKSGIAVCIFADGAHDAEGEARWTGPENHSTLFVSADRRYPTEIRLGVKWTIDGSIFETARLEVNDQKVPLFKCDEPGDRILAAVVPAYFAMDNDRMKLKLVLSRTISPQSLDPQNGDVRQIGLGLTYLETRSLIAGEVYRCGVTKSLEQTIARGPAPYIYSLYRDLLGREPDGDGQKYYLEKLASEEQSWVGLMSDFVMSEEFTGLYRSPEIRDTLLRYLP